MATFNVSFLNPALKSKGGSGVGVLADQLQILENTLAKDGYLSPGDYDVLIAKAREIQMGNNLSSDQRSNYDVKISQYERSKNVAKVEEASDIERMNKTMKSEASEDVMVVGNRPLEFINGRIASIQAKLNDIAEVIEQKTASGQDTTDYYNEYNATLQTLRDKIEAKEAMSSFDQNNPVQGFVAYVTTNKNGEIVDVDYGRYGEKSGYAETNGMIDGFQVYGKINYKEDGKNYFKLGNKTFTAADMLIQDPNNPGAFKPSKLMADVQDPSGRGLFTRAKAGYVNMPGESLSVQSYLPNNSWAKGVNGTIYKRDESGKYVKYLNANETDLGIEGPVLNMPEAFEQSLMRNVTETIDYSAPVAPDQGMNMTPATDLGMSMAPELQGPAAPAEPIKMNYGLENPFQPSTKKQTYRTPKQPSQQVDKGAIPTAKRTIMSGIESVRRLFT